MGNPQLTPIKDYPCYLINQLGMVYSSHKEGFLVQSVTKTGYAVVSLCVDGRVDSKRVHRIVADTFIPNPENKPFVNHIDGNKLNNSVCNLEWVFPHENVLHAIKAGLFDSSGNRNGNCRNLAENVEMFCRLYSSTPYMEISGLANQCNLSLSTAYKIIDKKTWRSVSDKYNIPDVQRDSSVKHFYFDEGELNAICDRANKIKDLISIYGISKSLINKIRKHPSKYLSDGTVQRSVERRRFQVESKREGRR